MADHDLPEESREIDELLAAAAAEEREILAASERETDAPGLAAAEQLLARQVAGATGAGATGAGAGGADAPAGPTRADGALPLRRIGTALTVLATAAAILAIVLSRLGDSGSGDPGPIDEPYYLGPDDPPQLVHPIGEVDSYGPFEWRGEIGEGMRIMIELYDFSGELPRSIGRPFHPESSPWTPPSNLDLDSVSRIGWTLSVLDPAGAGDVTSASGEAWLSER